MNNFLTGINHTIGENLRFARNFAANPQAYTQNSQSQQTSQSQASDPLSSMINPLMMMMLFQMMSRMMTQMGAGLPGEPYPPGLPMAPAPSPAPRNDAVDYLDQLFGQKTPDESGNIALSDDDVSQIRADLQSGALQVNQLGQALKYELDKAPDAEMPAVSRLISDLTDSGELNAAPFLQNGYLDQLSDGRRDVLLQSLELSGLRMDSGQPNTRFIGFMLGHLGRTDQPRTQAFLQQFLQDFYDAHGQTPDTPVGQILAQVLKLAGVEADDQNKLVF